MFGKFGWGVSTGGFMGSLNLRIDIPRLVALYQSGRLKLDELITARYPLDRINEAIASTEKGEALRNVIVSSDLAGIADMAGKKKW